MKPGRSHGVTVIGVATACLALAATVHYGLSLADSAVSALPCGREIAVLGVLGISGAIVYVASLLVILRMFGVRLPRS